MTSPPSPRPPIQTADPLLPLAEGEFTWQQFESFSEDYVRVLAGTDKVYRYGTRESAIARISVPAKHRTRRMRDTLRVELNRCARRVLSKNRDFLEGHRFRSWRLRSL